MRVRHFRRVLATAGLLLAAGGSAGLALGDGVRIPQARPAVEGNRAPYDLVFSRDGKLAYVTEMAEAAVAVVDVQSLTVLKRVSTGGERPAGLALTRDDTHLLVANTYSGNIALIEVATGRRTLISLPGMPYGVAVAPDGKRGYVTLSQLDQVAVLGLPEGAVVGRISVGRRPQALDLSPDGTKLAVANLAGGTISVIDTASLKEEAQVPLKGVNVRGIAVTGDGAEAYATVMPAFNRKSTSDPAEIWHNIVQAVSLNGSGSAPAEDQWMDFARLPGAIEVVGSPDQHDIVLDRDAKHAWVAVAGRDVLTRITIHDRRRDAIWPISQVETPVGASPRGLALTPDGCQVWVANHLGNSLSVVDAGTAKVLKTIDLGKPSRQDPSILGRYLFGNAALTRTHRFTCSSCHPDGGVDGLTWSFVHVKDGVDRRNTRDLRAGVGDTAPFRWSGFDRELPEFINSEVTGLLGGPEPSGAQSRALRAAVDALRLPPNPYREADGRLTPAGLQGKALFEGKAGCAGCHAGPKRGGTGLKRWAGTTPEGRLLDVPHLTGVYDGAPYLHDGRAATLEEVFGKYNRAGKHGSAAQLTQPELQAVLAYVRQL